VGGLSLLAGVGAAVLLASPTRVCAHDPPEAQRIYFAEPPTQWVLSTNRGILFGDTESRQFALSCSETLGLALGEAPGFAFLSAGRWLAATQHGLKSSGDHGCTWQGVEPFATAMASALVTHPKDVRRLYVAISAPRNAGLYESLDEGAHWTKRLGIDADDYIAQIALAPSEPQRIYVSGLIVDRQRGSFSFQITRSRDAGASWQRAYIPLLPDEDAAVLAAVSALHADTLLVLAHNRRRGEAPDRALMSRDAGTSFTELARGLMLTSASFTADGKALIAGSDGFYASDAALQNASAAGQAQQLSCVQLQGPNLYACGHANGFDPKKAGVFMSTDNAESWQSAISFTEVRAAFSCKDTSTVCQQIWTDWQLEVLVGLGGAPLDSVAGWQSFKGIDSSAPSLQAHTLSSATLTDTPALEAAPDADSGCTLLFARGASRPIDAIGWLVTWLGARTWRSRRARGGHQRAL
jgi:hypothetical protein